MGPTGGFIKPLGELDFDEVYQIIMNKQKL